MDPREAMEPRPEILVVDDEPASRETLCVLLRTEGYAPVAAADGLDALDRLSQAPVPLVIADLRMPRMDGLTLLREIERRELPSTVLVVTGWGDIRSAVEAMRLGAYDYLTKPVDPQRLLPIIAKVLETQRARATLGAPRRATAEPAVSFRGMVGASAPMREVFDLIERVAPSKANVLIVGESGTGKELVARAIHELSPRSAQPYVAVSSAGLPVDLLDSELFGCERGAYAGASSRKEGGFELASRGSVFLEEVADLPLATQAQLVRVLEGQPYRRLGGTQEYRTDARVLAATSRDIDPLVADGRFRRDLYFRLSTVEIHLPALRDRVEDLPLLVQTFLTEFAQMYGKVVRKVSPGAMDRLLRHPWPGNVRELRNAIERAVILTAGSTVTPEDLPPSVREPGRVSAGRTEGLHLCSIEEMQRRLIAEALARFPTRSRAAEVLGVSPRTLYNRIRRYGLDGRGAAAPPSGLPEGDQGPSPRSLSRSA